MTCFPQGPTSFLFVLLLVAATTTTTTTCRGVRLPSFDRETPDLNRASFDDLELVIRSSPDSLGVPLFRLATAEDLAEIWRMLLSMAARTDLYATANLAVQRINKLLADKPALNELICVGSETIALDDGRPSPTISYYLLGEGVKKATTYPDVLPRDLPIADPTSSCVPAASLHIPRLYEPPSPYASRRQLAKNEAPAEYAIQAASHSHSVHLREMRVLKIEEETIRIHFNGSFVIGIVALPSDQYLLAVYRRESTSLDYVETHNVDVTFQDDENNRYQTTVSLAPSTSKRRSPAHYSVLKSVRSHSGVKTRRQNVDQPLAFNIMTYNIWNYNTDWNQRKRLIAEFIAEKQPDLVGVQEIRYRYSGGPNQLMEIADELRALNLTYNFIYQPAMYYDSEAEGVGVLSRYPILDHEYINLTFVPGTPDGNRRIVLRALVLDEESHQLFNFFATHFTYARGEGQMSNAYELFNFMKRQRVGIPQSVVADFNIYVGSEEPTNFLTGKLTYRGMTGNLSDVWELAHNPDGDLGYTFSNLPSSSGLVNRADRVMVRNMLRVNVEPNTTHTTGRYVAGSVPASDHLAVYSLVAFVPPVA